MRIPLPAAALALGGSLALAALAAPAAQAASAAGAAHAARAAEAVRAAQAAGPGRSCQSLGVAGLYGEFVEGDDTHTPDAEGAVAVGGNADFTGGFSVGQELTPEQVKALLGGNALVVAGRVTGPNTQVMKGNGVYGSKAAGAVIEAHQGTVAQGASPIDFKAEFARLRTASAALASAPQTAGATVGAKGAELRLTAADAGLNSFTVSAATLQGATDVFLKVPAGSVTVINVTGDAYDMAAARTTGFHLWDDGKQAYVLDDKLQSAAGGAVRSGQLWNFPSATKVVKNSAAAWAGTVLAPNAAFDLGSGGPVNGSVIAKSLTGRGGAETHHHPFTGCLPAVVPSPTTVPTAPTVPPVVPGGSPSATTTPGVPGTPTAPATPGTSGSPSAPVSGRPTPGASASPSASAPAAPSAPASPSATATGGNLAHTGSGPVVPLAIGGAVVIAAGGAIVVAARRRAARRS